MPTNRHMPTEVGTILGNVGFFHLKTKQTVLARYAYRSKNYLALEQVVFKKKGEHDKSSRKNIGRQPL